MLDHLRNLTTTVPPRRLEVVLGREPGEHVWIGDPLSFSLGCA